MAAQVAAQDSKQESKQNDGCLCPTCGQALTGPIPDIIIDRTALMVYWRGAPLFSAAAKVKMDMFICLWDRPNNFVSRQEIIDYVHGAGRMDFARSIEVIISNINKILKTKRVPYTIVNKYKVGWRIVKCLGTED